MTKKFTNKIFKWSKKKNSILKVHVITNIYPWKLFDSSNYLTVKYFTQTCLQCNWCSRIEHKYRTTLWYEIWHLTYYIFHMTYAIVYIISDIWHLTLSTWHMTYDRSDIWHLPSDICNLTYKIWHLVYDVWHLVYDVWHLIAGIWHQISDIWHMTSDIWHWFEHLGDWKPNVPPLDWVYIAKRTQVLELIYSDKNGLPHCPTG